MKAKSGNLHAALKKIQKIFQKKTYKSQIVM
jgi:hypothetical protein